MTNISTILGYEPTLYDDDGHGNETNGKRTPLMPDSTVILENEFNKAVTAKLHNMARAIGFRAVALAPEDNDIPLSVRSSRANSDFAKQVIRYPHINKDLLAVGVSVHFNAFDGVMDSKARKGGIEVFYKEGRASGKRLADIMLKHLIQGTKQVNRGVKTQNLHMTRELVPTFVLAECGFMDVSSEAKLMRSEAFRTECATEILSAICEYYGQDYSKLSAEAIKPSAEVPQTLAEDTIKKLQADLSAMTARVNIAEGKLKKIYSIATPEY